MVKIKPSISKPNCVELTVRRWEALTPLLKGGSDPKQS
jgi:hypothetical protein